MGILLWTITWGMKNPFIQYYFNAQQGILGPKQTEIDYYNCTAELDIFKRPYLQ